MAVRGEAGAVRGEVLGVDIAAVVRLARQRVVSMFFVDIVWTPDVDDGDLTRFWRQMTDVLSQRCSCRRCERMVFQDASGGWTLKGMCLPR